MVKSENEAMRKAVEKYKKGAVIMVELPSDEYNEAIFPTVKMLTESGFNGLYVSFNRPFKNIFSLLTKNGVNTDMLLFVDGTPTFESEHKEENQRCIHVDHSLDVDDLVKAIYTSLPKMRGKRRFVFIDSLTTMALYKPLSEIMRFSEFLVRIAKRNGENIFVIFNIAKDIAQKEFLREISLQADEVISLVE